MILKITNRGYVVKAINGENELFTMAYEDLKHLRLGDVLTLSQDGTILLRWDYLKTIELCNT